MTTKRHHIQRFLPLYTVIAAAAGTLAFARIVVSPTNFDWPAWVQAVGSIAAILVAVWVSSDQAKQQRARDVERERDEINGMLRSLRGELETTLVYIHEVIAPRLSETQLGEPVISTFPLPEFPFPIYDSLTSRLGAISDPGLHRQIIHAYARAKSLAMTVTQHNDLVEDLVEANARRRAIGIKGSGLDVARAHSTLVSYTDSLRTSLAITQNELVALLETLTHRLPVRE